MSSRWTNELGMPNKGGDGYQNTVRGKEDIGLDLLKEVERIGARESSIPRCDV